MGTLIVGANSFVAAAFARDSAKHGRKLVAVFNQNKQRIDDRLYTQVLPFDELKSAKDIHNVVFFASHIPYGSMNDTAYQYNNVLAKQLQCVATFPDRRFIYCSSVSVYGYANQRPITETTPLNQPTIYGYAKLAGESVTANCGNGYSLRIGSVYGHGMSESVLIGRWCNSATRCGEILVLGDGSRSQDYIHVNDVARCLQKAVTSEVTGVGLCVSGESISNINLANKIAELQGHSKVKLTGIDSSPSFSFNNKITRAKLGWAPEVGLEQGLVETLNIQ